MISSRMNQKPVPWRSLVPDLIAREMMPADERPYSAEKPFVMTLNSEMASTLGLTTSFWRPWEAMDWLLLSIPSIMNPTSEPRWPPIDTPWPRDGATPAEIKASWR